MLKFCRAISGLRTGLTSIIKNIAEHTHWAVTVLAGGPRPSKDGNIETFRYVFIICPL
jgi:hypothetical protein